MHETTHNGLLLVVFVVHLSVFTLVYLRRRRPYYLVLCVAFAALTSLYLLKLLSLEPVPAGVSLHVVLRAVAIACTIVFVLLRLPAWVGRLRGV